MSMIDPDEIEALLPWYVNGTLGEVEREKVRRAVSESPRLARSLNLAEEERLSAIAGNEAIPGPAPRILEKLMKEVRADARARRFMLREQLSDQLGHWLQSLSPATLGWATAAAVLLIVGQLGLIGGYVASRPGSTYETASAPEGAAIAEGTELIVRFQPAADVASLTRLLAANGAVIVDGPRAGGIYRMRLEAGREDEAAIDHAVEMLRQEDEVIAFIARAPDRTE